MSKDNQPKLIKTNTYIIEEKIYDNGQRKMRRTVEGFRAIELLGILEYTQLEIMQQMSGLIKPDIIERKVIVEKNEENICKHTYPDGTDALVQHVGQNYRYDECQICGEKIDMR